MSRHVSTQKQNHPNVKFTIIHCLFPTFSFPVVSAGILVSSPVPFVTVIRLLASLLHTRLSGQRCYCNTSFANHLPGHLGPFARSSLIPPITDLTRPQGHSPLYSRAFLRNVTDGQPVSAEDSGKYSHTDWTVVSKGTCLSHILPTNNQPPCLSPHNSGLRFKTFTPEWGASFLRTICCPFPSLQDLFPSALTDVHANGSQPPSPLIWIERLH